MESFNFEALKKEKILEKAGIKDTNATESKIEMLENSIEAIKRQMEQVGEPTKKSLEAQIAAKQKQLEELKNKKENFN
ncbi:MAG: hypothetical protein AAB464_00025 [Patescibacteria group bacterium]